MDAETEKLVADFVERQAEARSKADRRLEQAEAALQRVRALLQGWRDEDDFSMEWAIDELQEAIDGEG